MSLIKTNVTVKMNRSLCICPQPKASLDILRELDSDGLDEEEEEVDEIDGDELVKDEVQSDRVIWKEIYDKFCNDRQEAAEFAESKIAKCDIPPSKSHFF